MWPWCKMNDEELDAVVVGHDTISFTAWRQSLRTQLQAA
mgnify:CR=1 FL=1